MLARQTVKTMNCNLTAKLQSLRHSVVVIGYGNELRSDDAIGPQVARAVQAWGVPSVHSLAVHQLTPELAETLAEAEMAIFVDACITPAAPPPADGGEEDGPSVRVLPLEPAGTGASIGGHASDPRTLLALAGLLYGRAPQAWLVTVPGVNFDLGEELSPVAETGMADALEEIDYLIRKSLSATEVAAQ